MVFGSPLCSKNAFRFKEQLGCIHSVQGICLGGLFVSLYVVLSLFNIRFSEILEFRLAFLALAAAAFYGGPLMGMTVGFTVLTAQRFGAWDMDGMRKTVGSAALLSLVVSLVLIMKN